MESQLALPRARTEKTAAILLDQMRGALQRRIDEICEMIIRQDFATAGAAVTRLCELSRVGLRLTEPWRIAVVGPVNAGKSSLINRLLGYERSIVTDVPGTDWDVLAGWTALDGWPIELLDTAGLRHTADPIESDGSNAPENSSITRT